MNIKVAAFTVSKKSYNTQKIDTGAKLLTRTGRVIYDNSMTNVRQRSKVIRAVTRDFQQCGILTSVDSDEPVQPPFKLRNPKRC